jgi:hypothetical protein
LAADVRGPTASIGCWIAIALVAVVCAVAGAETPREGLPPYIREPERLPVSTRAEIAAIWNGRTLSRTAHGEPARVPLDLYRLFLDTPEVTTSAGRYLGVGHYRAVRTGPDVFDVEDGEGARGDYRVVLRTPTERLIVARARRTVRLVGEVRGVTVTLLTLVPDVDAGRPRVLQRLDSAVRIEHRVVAVIARVLVPLFPQYADRKIGEVFAIATRVAAWAAERPQEFCAWLATEPDAPRHRATFAAALPACATPVT